MIRSTNYYRLAAVSGLFLVASSPLIAKNSRTIHLSDELSLAGVALVPGFYQIDWKSHSPEATVAVKSGKRVLVRTEARWVARNTKYASNAVVYDRRPDGSRELIELRFAKMSQALVFNESGSQSEPTASLHPSCRATAAGPSFMVADNGLCIQLLGKPRLTGGAVPSSGETYDSLAPALRVGPPAGGPHRK